MKIQILISESSWANNYKKEILNKLKKFSNKVKILNNHKELKKNDINIIFSYFKIIPKVYLKKSKINLIPHESNLPKGKGMSPLTWQILKGKKKIKKSILSQFDLLRIVDNKNYPAFFKIYGKKYILKISKS